MRRIFDRRRGQRRLRETNSTAAAAGAVTQRNGNKQTAFQLNDNNRAPPPLSSGSLTAAAGRCEGCGGAAENCMADWRRWMTAVGVPRRRTDRRVGRDAMDNWKPRPRVKLCPYNTGAHYIVSKCDAMRRVRLYYWHCAMLRQLVVMQLHHVVRVNA